MNTAAAKPLCLVTGARGYLGGRVTAVFRARGWHVRALTREPRPGADDIRFTLGETLSAPLPAAEALVHCAYDFDRFRWGDSFRINVTGTEKLLRCGHGGGRATHRRHSPPSAPSKAAARFMAGRNWHRKRASGKAARSYSGPDSFTAIRPARCSGALVAQVEKSSRVPS